ncbi:hypothetical protein C8A05DRAFT_35487 [Staphylotrichum tortipilum]|uniref:Uncharacterized protein n=1 Tax=Staphylotrichum tortipilum TaxID=2831512 RepID=A0AAN6MIM2_9PEZI|nr:hypothetical protein C8A05DRAFT_35487 [Staphylotrichum longicolle]
MRALGFIGCLTTAAALLGYGDHLGFGHLVYLFNSGRHFKFGRLRTTAEPLIIELLGFQPRFSNFQQLTHFHHQHRQFFIWIPNDVYIFRNQLVPGIPNYSWKQLDLGVLDDRRTQLVRKLLYYSWKQFLRWLFNDAGKQFVHGHDSRKQFIHGLPDNSWEQFFIRGFPNDSWEQFVHGLPHDSWKQLVCGLLHQFWKQLLCGLPYDSWKQFVCRLSYHSGKQLVHGAWIICSRKHSFWFFNHNRRGHTEPVHNVRGAQQYDEFVRVISGPVLGPDLNGHRVDLGRKLGARHHIPSRVRNDERRCHHWVKNDRHRDGDWPTNHCDPAAHHVYARTSYVDCAVNDAILGAQFLRQANWYRRTFQQHPERAVPVEQFLHNLDRPDRHGHWCPSLEHSRFGHWFDVHPLPCLELNELCLANRHRFIWNVGAELVGE